MGAIFEVIGKILGIGSGASVVNNVGGIITHAAMIPAIGYLITHADQQINFETSLGFLALISAFAYVVIEVLRRSAP